MESARLKVEYAFSPSLIATYQAGLFLDDDITGVETYLRDANGVPVEYRKFKHPFAAPYRAGSSGARIGLPAPRASMRGVPVA